MKQVTKFFVDPEGNYLGGFAGAKPPAGGIEVASPPEHGRDIWDGNTWISHLVDPVDYPLNKVQFKSALEELGLTVSQVKTAINGLDMTEKAKRIAKFKVSDSDVYRRDNELFNVLKGGFNLTDAQIDAAWMEAKDIH